MNASTRMGRLVVDELVRHGVRDAVLAPGSRSAPLALALHAADAAGRLRLHVRVDERSAGFVALGLARGSRLPVPVVTTSGSAVANLHPSVLEAHHAGLPVLVLSADRPAELRGTGANQTTDQVGLFGSAVRCSVDVPADHMGDAAVAAWRAQLSRAVIAATGATSRDPGPVQVNLCFAPPLVPDPDDDGSTPTGRGGGRPWTTATEAVSAEPVPLPRGPRTVVVAGADAQQPARELAESADWPLVAEPTSGARTGPNALRCGTLLLGHERWSAAVERVVVAGRPTLSRATTTLLGRADVKVVVLCDRSRWNDPGARASTVVPAVRVQEPPSDADDAWWATWRAADQKVAAAVDETLADLAAKLPDGELLGPEVARAVSAAVLPGATLHVGSSQPLRDLDLVGVPYPVGGRRFIVGNRGLSGIDGAVSTAIGTALGRPSPRSLALVGDLTFLHDANGLLLGPDEPRPDLTIVVANDHGGSIFATLEPGEPQHAGAFERVFGTPTGADLAALCAAYGTPHHRVLDTDELADLLAGPVTGVRVLEAVVDRVGRRELSETLRASADKTLGTVSPVG